MKASHLPIFCSPSNSRADLSFIGDKEDGELLNGKILCAAHEVGHIEDGVASFVESGHGWAPESIRRLRESGQLFHNWGKRHDHAKAVPYRRAFCDELAALDGIILEVAAGPGGGHTPGILHRNPEAQIILNDICADILRLWREFLRDNNAGNCVSEVAFDARKQLLKDDGLAGVSNAAGFSNIAQGERALREVCRALQPGGILTSFELIVEQDGWRRMPEDVRAEREETMGPILTEGCVGLLKRWGMEIEIYETSFGRKGDPEADGLVKFASRYGVALDWNFEYVKARKPLLPSSSS